MKPPRRVCRATQPTLSEASVFSNAPHVRQLTSTTDCPKRVLHHRRRMSSRCRSGTLRTRTQNTGGPRATAAPYRRFRCTWLRPVRAWLAWLEVSGIAEGPAFRPVDRHGHIGATRLSGQAVALVLKRHAARAGLDPGEVSGHSLRAGLATSAAAAGVPERVIAEQTGHKGTVMLRRYIREGSLFRENAASAVGL